MELVDTMIKNKIAIACVQKTKLVGENEKDI